jgi:hypothetical protein
VTIAQGIPSSIVNLMQDRTLERVFHDPLFANLIFRGEARPELWQANLGERQIFTRTGLIVPKTKPLIPGQDPPPSTYSSEQWEAEARQHGDSLDTHMPTSYVTLASTFLNNTKTLGLGAAQTMNRVARNRMFNAYLGGETVTTAAVAAGATTVPVASLNGFTEKILDGRLLPVSPTNPLRVTFSGTAEPANNVIGFTPNNPAVPNGAGTLTLAVAITAAGLVIRGGVFADTRSRRIRVGAGATPDALTAANIVTLDTFIDAVARLRGQNVPPHGDGYYHVHLSTEAEAQLFRDNHWQRLHQSLPDSTAYRTLAIGQAVGCIFYRNTELPSSFTVDPADTVADPGGAGGATFSPEVGGELTNEAGLPIRRSIVTGGGVIYEKYLDESKFITEAGVTGKIGQFSIVNGGVAVMAQRIRYILRAPLDRLQQILAQSWSWSGDFPVPSDTVAGDASRFKRAVIVEHA